MAKKLMIHKGAATYTTPAVVRAVFNSAEKKWEDKVVTPEKTQKAKLPKGTMIGGRPVGVEVTVSDPEEVKTLTAKGFEVIDKKAPDMKGPSKEAEQERERALEQAQDFTNTTEEGK